LLYFFSDRVSHFSSKMTWTAVLLLPLTWDDRCVPPCPTFIGWDGVSWTFYLGWPPTAILLISASWVASITGLSHRAQRNTFMIFTLFLDSKMAKNKSNES
jgi:hypothetical protein